MPKGQQPAQVSPSLDISLIQPVASVFPGPFSAAQAGGRPPPPHSPARPCFPESAFCVRGIRFPSSRGCVLSLGKRLQTF
jgi:hypothetical protein